MRICYYAVAHRSSFIVSRGRNRWERGQTPPRPYSARLCAEWAAAGGLRAGW